MKILLVQSHSGRAESLLLFPIGLCYIGTVLTKHNVEILDLNVWDVSLAYEILRKKISEFSPDIVGISIRNIDTTQRMDPFVNFKTIRPTINIVKDVNPGIKIMVGGAGFSIFAKKIMEKIPEIDFGIYLEGEESVLELLDNPGSPEKVKGIFFRENDRVQFTGPRVLPDFNSIPTPRRDIPEIDITKYMGPTRNLIGVQSKRGCIFECSYCSYPFLNGKNIRLREPSKVVDEVEYLTNTFNVRRFSFVDSIFNVPESHARDICKEIIRRNLEVEWEAWCDLRNFSKDFVILAKEAGCRHIGFSPDAASNKGLSALKKGITEKDIKNSLKIIGEVKEITAGYGFFCSYPGQNFRGLIKTILLFLKIPILSQGRVMVIPGWIRIEPHTEIYQRAIEEKIIDKETELLAENEDALLKLFYTPSSQWYVSLIMVPVLGVVDRVFKPLAKLFFRIIAKIRRVRPFCS